MKFLICFGIFWSTLTLMFDGLTFVPAVRQVWSVQFPSTEGTILTSEVTTNQGDDGPVYNVKFTYAYAVDLRKFTGTRYRYSSFASSSNRRWAHAEVGARPPGTKIPVYYDPSNPENALLSPGLNGSDLFMMMFLTPFNMVMLAFWYIGGGRLWRRLRKPEAGGVRLWKESHRTIVRLNEISPLACAAATVALLAFLSIFVVGFGLGGFQPTLRVMTLTWLVILGGGILSALWFRKRIASGDYDLVLDEMNGALELPRTRGRKVPQTVSAKKIRSAMVLVQSKTDSEGSVTRTYVPMLVVRDGQSVREEQLVEWQDKRKADEFVAWLRERLSLAQEEETVAR